MLVLSRGIGESIQIGEDIGEVITVTVLDVRGGQVRVGIDAPRKVQVLREELVGNVRQPPSVPTGESNIP